MSEELTSDQLIAGENYFLVGYLDQKLHVQLDCIKTVQGLIDELREQCLAK